jgi:hypothetical protein
LSRQRSEELALLLRVVHHDVRLSETTKLDEKLDRLLMLADDLKDEALQLLHKGNPDDLPQLAELYQHVLLQGLGKRALHLPADVKRKVMPALLKKLRANEAQLRAAARDAAPLVAAMLQPMQEVTQETITRLRSGRAPGPGEKTPPGVREPSALLATLVLHGLKLSDENDPLQRADLCAELAQRVVPSVVLVSTGSDTSEAGDLVEGVATLLNRGVVNNLDKAEDGAAQQRLAEMQKVRRRLLQILAVLDENLAHAPPAARSGLENAMRAANYARREAPGKLPVPAKSS